MTIKRVMRYDPTQRKFRLFRLLWQRGKVGDGKGHSGKLSVSFWPKWFNYQTEFNGWRLTILGVSIHKLLSYGGRFV